jgi:hypothetical protein
VVLRDDELRFADIFELHGARILSNFGARAYENHDLRPGVRNVYVRPMSALVPREDPDLELAEAALRHFNYNPCSFG